MPTELSLYRYRQEYGWGGGGVLLVPVIERKKKVVQKSEWDSNPQTSITTEKN